MKWIGRNVLRLLGALLAIFLGLFGIFRRREPLDPEEMHIDDAVHEQRRRIRDIVHPPGSGMWWR